MHKNIVWTLPMLLAAAFTIGGCGKTTLPAAPTALTAPDGNYVVSGTVTGLAGGGGVPLAGVNVIARSGPYSRTVHTDADGNFVLDRLTAGEWTVTVEKRGFMTDAKVVSIADSDASISFELPIDEES